MKSSLPNPSNASLDDVLTAMHASPTKKGFIRLQAIHFLLQGFDKDFVAKAALSTVRTVNRWIVRFNESGIDGLIDRPRPGRPCAITTAQAEYIQELLDTPSQADKEHWTLCALHGYLIETISLECSYSTLVRTVHRQGYVLRFPRSQPMEQDEEKRRHYLEKLKVWEQQYDEIWYIDECGIEGDPRPRRRWVKKGEKRTVPYSGLHIRESVIGAVCSQTGEIEALQVSHCNAEIFQIFLDQLAKQLKGRNVLLILDNASWHRAKALNWHGLEHAYLPPYSPDFNPIERLWLRLKAEFFTDWIAKTPQELTQRITKALLAFMKKQTAVKSICA